MTSDVERQRACRRRQRLELQLVSVEIPVQTIAALIAAGRLSDVDAANAAAVGEAVSRIVSEAVQNIVTL